MSILIIICLYASALGAAAQDAVGVLLLSDITVIDGVRTRVATHRDVLIRGSRITDVAPAGSVRLGSGIRRVDGKGKFVIPGLWDMHTHALDNDRSSTWLPLFVANGVIGIRDMGSPLPPNEIRAFKNGAVVPSPHIYTAGKIVGGPYPHLSITPSSPEDARRVVRDLRTGGSDFIKVYSLLPRDMFLAVVDEARRERITVAGHVPLTLPLAEAGRAGMKSFEHGYGLLEACSTDEPEVRARIEQAASGKTSPASAWGAVVQETDRAYGEQAVHGTYSAAKCMDVAARLVKDGVWQCPTLVVRRAFAMLNQPDFIADSRLRYVSGPMRRRWEATTTLDDRSRGLGEQGFADRKVRLRKESEMAVALLHAGVGLLAGTDCGNAFVLPGFSVHDELELLVNAGASPFEALQSATLNPARFLGRERDFGTVENGKVADLVILNGNPLEDIRNSRNIEAVIQGGRLFDRRQLDRILIDTERAVQ